MKEKIYFTFLLLLSIISIYSGSSLKLIFFGTFLVFYIFSKKDFLYIIFVFLAIQYPGGLFYPPHDAFIEIGTNGVSFSFVFILTGFFKYLFLDKRRLKILYPFKNINWILLYSLFLVLISLFIGVASFNTLSKLFKTFVSLLFYIIIIREFKNKQSFIQFISLFFFVTIILFVWQLHDIVFTRKIASFFGITEFQSISLEFGLEDGRLIRVFYAPYFSFLTLLFSLYFLLNKNIKRFSKKYLIFLASISLISMLLTGTRGYSLQYIFVFIVFLFLSSRQSLIVIPSIILILWIAALVFPIFEKQIDLSTGRLSTVLDFVKGDVTADNTLVRFTQRAPKVWNKYIEKPFFGFGYSHEGRDYNDDHVGNVTIFLQSGILGVTIYLMVLISIFLKIYNRILNTGKKKENLLIFAGVFSLIIAHSTSSTVFSYYFEPHIICIFGILLGFIKIFLFNIEERTDNQNVQ